MAANARFGIHIKMPKDFGNKILDAIEKEFVEKVKSNVPSIAFRVEGIVNQTVYENRHLFIPNDAIAGELGIQSIIGAGKVDEEKRSGAWRTLLIGSPDSAGYVKWEPESGGGKFARIRVGWDKEKFYSHPRSMVNVYDLAKGKRTIIPWMKWFLEGELISGSSYRPISKGRIKEISRTGIGIMVQGGVWSIAPSKYNLDWLAIEASKNIKEKLSSTFSKGKASYDALTKPRRDI